MNTRKHKIPANFSARIRAVVVAAAMATGGPVAAGTKYFTGASTGVWTTSTANWATASGGPYNSLWVAYDDGVFEGVPGTVAVSSVNANSIRCSVTGYVLSGGTITLGSPSGGPAITVDAGLSVTIGSSLARAGGGAALRKLGTGTLVFTGNTGFSSYGLAVNEGTLEIGGAGQLDSGSYGGTLSVANGATLKINSTATTNLTTSATGIEGNLGKSNSGSLAAKRLNFNSQGSAQTFTMSTGTLACSDWFITGMGNGSTNGTGRDAVITQTGGDITVGYVANSSQLQFANWGGTTSANFSGGTLTMDTYWTPNFSQRGTGNVTISGTAVVTSKNAGGIGLAGQTGSQCNLVVQTGGTLVTTAITKGNGTANLTIDGGTLKAYGSSAGFLGGLSSAKIGNGGMVIDSNGFDITISQPMAADGASSGGLTKLGGGTVRLGAANTYGGATNVNNGSLLVNNPSGSGTGTGPVTVAPGATLGGTGSVAGPTSIHGSLNAGNGGGALETLAFGGTLNLSAAQKTIIDIAGSAARGTDHDGIDVAGALTQGGALELNFPSTVAGGSHLCHLIVATAGRTGGFSSVTLTGVYSGSLTNNGAGIWSYAAGGQSWQFNQNTGDLSFTTVDVPIPYATLQELLPGDSDARIIEKAAKLLPRPNQVDWQRMESTFFIHYGPNAFNGVEWGTGYESPSVFNPTALHADQWVQAVQDAGGKMVMLVAKHHEGFCLWPSRYTSQDVASSPWLGGSGDVVRAVSEACAARGLKFGVYLSPADLFQIKSSGGYYGNGSSVQASTIPTDPAVFSSAPGTGRIPPPGKPVLAYIVDDYNRYFLNQLYELLTEYGAVHEVWFDGANPDSSTSQTYNRTAWYDLIRQLRPEAVIAVKGPDVRWVGNESGYARTTEWSPLPVPVHPDQFSWGDMTATDLGSRAKLTRGSFLTWYPAETDVPILNGWFWSAAKSAKSASTLLGIYYTSVGRNSNLLLNISPDTRGLIPANQLAPLQSFGQIVRNTFAINHATGALASGPAGSLQAAGNMLDGNPDTFWEAAGSSSTGELILDLAGPRTFDVISLQEPIAQRGQRIEGVIIDTWDGSTWTNRATATTVGHKRLLKLAAPVTCARVRITITACRLNPSLAEVGFYKEAIAIAAPTIGERDASANVAITGTAGLTLRYTIDGSPPTGSSPIYSGPIPLPFGGTILAASFGADGLPGIVASRDFANLAPTGWSVLADSQANTTTNAPVKALDDDPATFWSSAATSLPHWLVVDMGATRAIGGFTYLPVAGGGTGTIKRYRFETSTDNLAWTIRADGSFGNIAVNPVMQAVAITPVAARYFRFTALEEITGSATVHVAELGIIPAGFDAWRRDHALQSITPAADPDGNGLGALLEYASGCEPGMTPATPLISIGTATAGNLRILSRRRNNIVGITEQLEFSTSLSGWTPMPGASVTAINDNGDGSSTIERTIPIAGDRMFYRVSYAIH